MEANVEEEELIGEDIEAVEMVECCIGALKDWTADIEEVIEVVWTENVAMVTAEPLAWISTLVLTLSVCEATSRRDWIGEIETELERFIVCVEDAICKFSWNVEVAFIYIEWY